MTSAQAKTYKIASIPGDGIGREVVPEGIRVAEAAARRFGFSLQWKEFDWSCEVYLQTGRMMPEDGLEQLRPFDAIFLGAVGHPKVPDHVSLWGLLIPIRRGFQQYANIRPVRLLPGIEPAVRNFPPGQIDFCVVRENNEGEYSNIGGRLFEGTEEEFAAAAIGIHAARMRPHHPLRFRAGENAPPPRDFGDEIQRHHLHHAVLGRALRRHGQAVSGNSHRPVSHRYSQRAFRAPPGLVRRGGRLKSLRRHSFGPWAGGRGLDWHRALGKSQSRTRISLHVRAGARLGAGHRRARASPIRSARSGPAR